MDEATATIEPPETLPPAVDLAALIRAAVAQEVAPLIQQVLEVEVSRRKVCSLSEACARYGKTRAWITALVTTKERRIRHAFVPGRGLSGTELSINIIDLAKAMGEL
jgi:hypothetical protein